MGAYTLIGSRVRLETQFILQPVIFRFWDSPDFRCCTLIYSVSRNCQAPLVSVQKHISLLCSPRRKLDCIPRVASHEIKGQESIWPKYLYQAMLALNELSETKLSEINILNNASYIDSVSLSSDAFSISIYY